MSELLYQGFLSQLSPYQSIQNRLDPWLHYHDAVPLRLAPERATLESFTLERKMLALVLGLEILVREEPALQLLPRLLRVRVTGEWRWVGGVLTRLGEQYQDWLPVLRPFLAFSSPLFPDICDSLIRGFLVEGNKRYRFVSRDDFQWVWERRVAAVLAFQDASFAELLPEVVYQFVWPTACGKLVSLGTLSASELADAGDQVASLPPCPLRDWVEQEQARRR